MRQRICPQGSAQGGTSAGSRRKKRLEVVMASPFRGPGGRARGPAPGRGRGMRRPAAIVPVGWAKATARRRRGFETRHVPYRPTLDRGRAGRSDGRLLAAGYHRHFRTVGLRRRQMTTTTKREQYAALVSARKRCRLCVGLRNPADAELAAFDSDEIGPWSRLHGDLDADLMIIGQDWGGVRYYAVNQGLDDLRNPTMRTLERLLRGIGLDISLAEYGAGARGVFLTNAVLCLKKGGLQAPVEWQWFENCGSHFLRRQIEIVAPRVAVALGQKAYEAVLGAFGLQVGPFRRAVENEL